MFFIVPPGIDDMSVKQIIPLIESDAIFSVKTIFSTDTYFYNKVFIHTLSENIFI